MHEQDQWISASADNWSKEKKLNLTINQKSRFEKKKILKKKERKEVNNKLANERSHMHTHTHTPS